MNSAVIASVGYDAASSTMDIEFKTGRVYRFFLITRTIYDTLMSSHSVGRHFNAEIRDRFPNREITDRA